MNNNDNNLDNTTIIPRTPTQPILPKDQEAFANNTAVAKETVNVSPDLLASNVPPVTKAVVPTQPIINNPVTQNINPVQPIINNVPEQVETLPIENINNQINPTNIPGSVTQSVVNQTIPAPPKMDDVASSSITPPPINNPANLNSNPNLYINDLTGGSKEASTQVTKKKSNKKIIIIVLIIILIIAGALGGAYYYTQYKMADKRIDAVFDGLTSFTSSITNAKVNQGSGNYTLNASITEGVNNYGLKSTGIYAYDLPNKKIDLTTNITSITDGEELLNAPLNVELYLESDTAYLLLQNFTSNYIYTNVENTQATIKDIESRFSNPDDIILFAILNYMYSHGLDITTENYSKIINNISQNDINYQVMLTTLKTACKAGLKASSYTESVDGSSNVITISLNEASQAKMISAFMKTFTTNTTALSQLSTLIGVDEKTLKTDLTNYAANYKGTTIEGNLVIKTDMFKQSFVSLSFPLIIDGNTYKMSLVKSGSGYNIKGKLADKEVINLTTSKTTTKSSTTNETDHTLAGTIYYNNKAYTINIVLNDIRNVTNAGISVITRNSIDYKYYSSDDRAALVTSISNYGNLGLKFKDAYVGTQTVSEDTTITP